jgi:hypothetical protein
LLTSRVFSTIRSERLRVRSEKMPEIKDSEADFAPMLNVLLKLKKKIFPDEDVVNHAGPN